MAGEGRAPWPPGGGEMGGLVRAHDWSATPLGPIEGWSPGLRTTVEIVLACGFPMVALWGPELIQVYNDGYRALMGDKHPAGLGQATRACWPEVWHINEPIYRRVLAGETVTFEDALYPIARHGALEDAWFTLSYSPVRGSDGDVGGVLVTVLETTAGHWAEAALREGEARFRALATAGTSMIYRMSPDWRRMHRLDGRDVLADTPEPVEDWADTYLLPEDQREVFAAIEEAIRTGSTFELEHRVRLADGGVGWVLSRAVPILGPDGEVVEWFGAASDITARREAEAVLRVARDAAEAANREKSRFLASVSHDLRQPVMAALLFVDLLRKRPLGGHERELVEPLADSVTNLNGMLTGLLEVARLDAGIVRPEVREFPLDELLGRLRGEFQGAAREAGLSLEVTQTGLSICSDPLLVELVLRNLLSNAIKFTEAGGVRVAVDAEAEDALLSVIDTGVGIPADQLERVFEDYVQLGKTPREHSRGFGIGLSTVRRVAALLGIEVAVRSTAGRGSTFALRLPLAEDRDSAHRDAATAEEGVLGGVTVLVVDDEALVLKALEMTLRSRGAAVRAARGLRDAAEALARDDGPPDAVVADYTLAQGERGTEIIAAARERGVRAAVLITGDTSPARMAEAERSGYRLLHKPVDPDRLTNLLTELLGRG
jgi:signal transduction histidine kinase/CheY-like chemotaxis protein